MEVSDEYKLNGLTQNTLPDILPNASTSQYIKVNQTLTGYELVPEIDKIQYFESTASTLTINLSSILTSKIIMVNLKGATGQTFQINNDLGVNINYSYNFTFYIFGSGSNINTINLIGDWLVVDQHFNVNTNFVAGTSNTMTYNSTEPNSSHLEFLYIFNPSDPFSCYWLIRRIGPFN